MMCALVQRLVTLSMRSSAASAWRLVLCGVHAFVVLGICISSRYFATVRRVTGCPALQLRRQLVVGQRLARVLLFNQLLHLALQQHQRQVAALRPVHALGEEEAQLIHALRGMHILVRHRAAHGRRMHPDLLRHLLDHHRLQPLLAALQKLPCRRTITSQVRRIVFFLCSMLRSSWIADL
jgi:hypothetical protein